MKEQYKVIIVGSGLAGLSMAARLVEEGFSDLAIVSSGYGGTPFIAALNAVLVPNPWGDTPKQHALDMVEAGYYLNDRLLVEEMCATASRSVELLQRWGVNFAIGHDGELARRHTSGSRYPRSLCQKTEILGNQLLTVLRKKLEYHGVTFYPKTNCLQVLVENNAVRGISIVDLDGTNRRNLYAPVVVAAWGGVGNLFPESTYPGDIDGRGLALAYEAGATLIDLEFVEFEPMICLWPLAAKGEPCPTAMLGEGAYLLNSAHERFLLKTRPQGEAGAPKTLINQGIWQELADSKGSPHGGVYVDLRHIPVEVLKGYPWFYTRLTKAGVDLSKELLEVGPIAHSHSGGLKVTSDYQTAVTGLFAAGEAVGGIHGACRLAGNAATQALVSGVLAAEGIMKSEFPIIQPQGQTPQYNWDPEVRAVIIPQVRHLVGETLGATRNQTELENGKAKLKEILASPRVNRDNITRQTALAALLIMESALLRRESRGSHFRSDYPETSDNWQCSIELTQSPEGEINWTTLTRP
ncbi:MAG TPA: L-aspartate oxidase [Firmicutes bacterium]|jgi:aspartate oxidase|nr:L-aspartate oxidase [Bacillota bacterium]